MEFANWEFRGNSEMEAHFQHEQGIFDLKRTGKKESLYGYK